MSNASNLSLIALLVTINIAALGGVVYFMDRGLDSLSVSQAHISETQVEIVQSMHSLELRMQASESALTDRWTGANMDVWAARASQLLGVILPDPKEIRRAR